MSITRSVSCCGKTSIEPLVPVGTIAALARIEPSGEFSVETSGCGCPVGQTARKPSVPVRGTTVTLSAYANAVEGIPHELERTGTVRAAPPAMNGPPNGPFAFRVSMIRHGVTGTNCVGGTNT